MFTGLIESTGEIVESAPTGAGVRVRISTPLAPALAPGDSLAVNGVCLTVIDRDGLGVCADIGPETLRVTTLGGLAQGSHVNLERAMRADSRFGGHIVQGHVDGVGVVLSVRPEGDRWLVDVRVPPEVDAVTILQGSITLSGVSLTVNALPAQSTCQVALIPHTLAVTTLGTLAAGDRVNLEGDLIGKYVGRMLPNSPYSRQR